MTIAISLKINDGLILASDSASTLMARHPTTGELGVVNVYNNANKVFNLKKGLPIGALTWGSGSIGAASSSTLVKDLRKRFSGDDRDHKDWTINEGTYTVEDVAQSVKRFMFDELYVPTFRDWPQKPDLGFIVAGYSPNASMADEYMIQITNGQCAGPTLLRKNEESGVTWTGMTEALNRLVVGFGSNLPKVLQQSLGVPAEQIGPAMTVIQQALNLPLVSPAMPLQDAIDLAEFLVDTTIKYFKFAPGAPSVGGPIEIAAISKHEKFRWVRRKYYFSRDLNPEENCDLKPGGELSANNCER